MNCDGCMFAEWRRTKTGRLHPDRGGRCTRLDEHPLDLTIPAAFYWVGGAPNKPSGGWIERGEEHKRPCEFKTVEGEA